MGHGLLNVPEQRSTVPPRRHPSVLVARGTSDYCNYSGRGRSDYGS